MKRYKHNLSNYHLTTMDMGKLYPINVLEVLPGDSFRHQTSALIRTPALTKPIMHPVSVRIHHFFVPNRLVWSGWEDFICGNVDETVTPIPTIAVAGPGEDLAHRMGVGTGTNTMSALPVRAFNKIFNMYYRDQDLVTELSEDQTDIPRIAWEKDYFTAARPWPQKGTAVTIPIEGAVTADGTRPTWQGTSTIGASGFDYTNATTKIDRESGAVGATEDMMWANTGLELTATSTDVREFREAFALQRYQEARARYGSEYVDYLRYCGVTPSDARLQRPEYLGGGKQTISFSEVVSTAQDAANSDIGDLAGHGIAAMRSNRYIRFFEEHGHVISVMSVRPKSLYMNVMPRKFSRTTKEDYFQKELQDIGQQEVLNKEVYSNHSTPEGTFGYANRYHEYTTEQSYVSGEMRTSGTGAKEWHLGRDITSDPTLNNTFVECTPSDRAWQSTLDEELQVMVQNSVQARRMVRRSDVGRII